MSETKQIATQTEVTINGTSLTIYTFYDPNAGAEDLQFFITELISTINNTAFVEGELGYNIDNMPNTSFIVDANGELIAIDIDTSVYSIDGLGYAILNSILETPYITSAILSPEGELTIIWTEVTGAIGYAYDISTDPQFIYYTPIRNGDAGNQTTFTITVDPNLIYYVRVRAYSATEWSMNSNVELVQEMTVAAPSGLSVTPVSDTEMLLEWANEDTYSSIYIEYSQDGENFTEFDIISGSLESAPVTGLTGSREYWWRIRGRVGSVYSEYSNVVSDWTAWKLILKSEGSGLDTTKFQPVGGLVEMTMTIDGNGKFYSDQAGTLDENTSITWQNSTTQYIKVSSGTSNLLVFHRNQITIIGQVSLIGGGGFGIYPLSGNSPSMNIILADIPKSISELCVLGAGAVGITGDLSDLSDSVLKIYFSGIGLITGSLADLPSTMLVYEIFTSNTVIANLWDIPADMVYIYLTAGCVVTGRTADIPSGNLKYFYNYASSNLITGTIADLVHVGCVLENFYCWNTSISGDIADIPTSVKVFSITGSNTVTGDIVDLKEGLTGIYLYGLNTVSGDLADLPSTLTGLAIHGLNTIHGNIADLPSGLQQLILVGGNTVFGNIAYLPSSLSSMEVDGNNILSGDIGDFPVSLRDIRIAGYNTITGDLVNLSNLVYALVLDGLNTIYGSLSSLSNAIQYMILRGQNIVSSYTGGKTWSSFMFGSFIFIPVTPGGLSSAQIDSLIIDLNNSLSTMNQPITLTGTNAPRTAASNAAVASLLAKGCVVTTN